MIELLDMVMAVNARAQNRILLIAFCVEGHAVIRVLIIELGHLLESHFMLMFVFAFVCVGEICERCVCVWKWEYSFVNRQLLICNEHLLIYNARF